MVVEIDRVIFGGGSRVSPFLLPSFFPFFLEGESIPGEGK